MLHLERSHMDIGRDWVFEVIAGGRRDAKQVT
jgi:hypothetical protein